MLGHIKYGSIAPLLKSNTFFAWNMIWWFWEKFLLTYCYLILWIINNQHHSASLSPLAIWNNIFIRVSFPLWKKNLWILNESDYLAWNWNQIILLLYFHWTWLFPPPFCQQVDDSFQTQWSKITNCSKKSAS